MAWWDIGAKLLDVFRWGGVPPRSIAQPRRREALAGTKGRRSVTAESRNAIGRGAWRRAAGTPRKARCARASGVGVSSVAREAAACCWTTRCSPSNRVARYQIDSDQGFFAREGGADDADVPRAAHAGGAAWNRCSGLGIGADSCKLRGGWSCGFSALLGKGARFRGLRAA